MSKPAYVTSSQRGSAGPDTALIQTWLNGVRDPCTYYAPRTVDGHYGRSTVRAVQEFQLRSGLEADGKVGQKTWDALYAQYAASHDGSEQYPGIPLRNGHTGAAIQSAQEQLNRKGARLTVDGHYGDRTQSAVRSFQKANGLTADGVIGSETWVRLYS